MKITELRIGNLIYEVDKFKGTDVVPVIGLVENDFNLLEHSGRIKPIPLTEEWLVKMGFEKNGYDYWTHTKEYFELGEKGGGEYCNSINCFEYSNGKNIKYVHQLQNLYFALTGEELKINLVD